MQPDGKIVQVGISLPTLEAEYDLSLARLLPDAPAAPPFFDFGGDRRADVSVFRQGNWYRINSNTNSFSSAQFGAASDKPVAADYDGDGATEVAVFRPSNGTWYTSLNPAMNYGAVQFGANGDLRVTADYDGDGKADRAVHRGGSWYMLNSQNNSFRAVAFGNATDAPVETAYQP